MQIPIGEEDKFRGVVDLVTNLAVIWNEADQAFQPFNREGAAVKLTQDNDWLPFDSLSLRVRFVKTVTALPVGVSLISPRAVV